MNARPLLDEVSDLNDALDVATAQWVAEHPAYGVLTSDLSGRVCGWNGWMELHSGRAATEVLGRPLLEVFPELAERGIARYFEAALLGHVGVVSQRLHGFLLRMPTDRGGDLFDCMQQSAQIAPLLSNGLVIGVIATITDVTDRVTRETELRTEIAEGARRLLGERTARAEAVASSLAKDEFLAVLSHELRTPLYAILGWAQVLREGHVAPQRVASGIAAIERNAQMQTQLIEDLLDVSRIVSGSLQIDSKPVSLRRPIEAAAALVAGSAATKGVLLSVVIDEDLPPVSGDGARLQQIVWNLLSNTVKFTPTGGDVSLHASSCEGSVVISVTDTGHGITAEFLPHVFDRFRQSDSSFTRAQGGLGLGLSIVKRLVELHGGTVTAASRGVGLGATFVVTLPALDPDRTPPPSIGISRFIADPTQTTIPLCGLRILFVDDDADGREVMALALSSEGAEVVVADSAADARAALVVFQPDVIVSDIGMPGEDGYALIRSIRRMTGSIASVPAIALTGFASLEDQRRAREAGFNAHLTKPVDIAVLVGHVAMQARRTDADGRSPRIA